MGCSIFFLKRKGKRAAESTQEAAREEVEALDVWSESGRHMGHLVKVIMFMYALELIVFG